MDPEQIERPGRWVEHGLTDWLVHRPADGERSVEAVDSQDLSGHVDGRRWDENHTLAVREYAMRCRIAGDTHQLALIRAGEVLDGRDGSSGGIDRRENALTDARDRKQGAGRGRCGRNGRA